MAPTRNYPMCENAKENICWFSGHVSMLGLGIAQYLAASKH
jgi:hypothetical protein